MSPDPARRDASRTRTLIGTIELIAGTVVVLALIALAIWFFFFAHNPLLRV